MTKPSTEDRVLEIIVVCFISLTAVLIACAIFAMCGGFTDLHKGEHCVQKTLTHHAKLSDSWDCTKWAKSD